MNRTLTNAARLAPMLLAAALLAQTTRDPTAVLAQARARLLAMTRRLHLYSCTETVDRVYFEAAPEAVRPTPNCGQLDAALRAGTFPLRLEFTDRLRLEVAVEQGHEIRSWPGPGRFDPRRVDAFIEGPGAIGTGAFGTYLLDIFENPGAQFQFDGEQSAEGQPILAYFFHVPESASHYQSKAGATWQTTAYSGEFQLDSESLDLRRLVIRTDELSAATSLCEASTTLDYQSVRIGDGDLLLPRQSRLLAVSRSAAETENLISFAGCREYQAESEILFDANPAIFDPTTHPSVRAPLVLPIGLPITLALAAPIDTDTAAGGDPISAKVVKPVRRSGAGATLIPAGAIVRGRIARLEHHLSPEPYFLVALTFNRLELGGISSPFAARLDQGASLARRLGVNLNPSGSGAAAWSSGVFLFPTVRSRQVIPAGYQSRWFTLARNR